MSFFFRQLRTLIRKNLLLIWNKRKIRSTIIRAYWAPIIFSVIMAIVLQALWPKVKYGVGQPFPIMSLREAVDKAAPGRPDLVFVNPFNSTGDVADVISTISTSLQGSKSNIVQLDETEKLLSTCRSNLRGVTSCFGAVVFNSSPSQGNGTFWSYTLRFDGAFGLTMDVNSDKNDQDLFMLPLQRAVDEAIAGRSRRSLPENTHQIAYTAKSQKEYEQSIKGNLQKGIINALAIVWYLPFVGVCYHMVGLIARERETGMTQLLEAMMPNRRRWETTVLRMWGHHIAFTVSYAPSWVIISILFRAGLYSYTNFGIVLVSFVLASLSLVSWSLLGAAFFRKTQLSGICWILFSLGLGVAAQVVSKYMSTTVVAVLGLLFSPMTFVFNLIYLTRWERSKQAAMITRSIGDWNVTGIVFWIYFALQIVVYPVLAVLVEFYLYRSGATPSTRKIEWGAYSSREDHAKTGEAVTLSDFTKTYRSGLLGHRKVKAVKGMSFYALQGQIVVLLGANGCGKSTTLNAIAGLDHATSGNVTIDGTGGIGICPQRNVLWDDLTVQEHSEIFTDLKTVSDLTKTERGEKIRALIQGCCLSHKTKAMSGTLSGGQKRKLQLICMLTGGSKVCCVDEVSGGLDPISRQSIWEILRAEKGKRTIVLTTHFLDEAEILADYMLIMKKGRLANKGTVGALKEKLGKGYRVTFLPSDDIGESDDKARVAQEKEKSYAVDKRFDNVADVLDYVNGLGSATANVQIAGPTIEEVFMSSAGSRIQEQLETYDDYGNEKSGLERVETGSIDTEDDYDMGEKVPPQDGKPVSSFRLTAILFFKRLSILRRNWAPYLAAFLLPVIATAVMCVLLQNVNNPSCDLIKEVDAADIEHISDDLTPRLLVGPDYAITPQIVGLVEQTVPPSLLDSGAVVSIQSLIRLVPNQTAFNTYLEQHPSEIVPGGAYLAGSEPTFAWRADIGPMSIFSPIFVQNVFDMVMSGVAIQTDYAPFEYPWPHNTGKTLQFVFYFGLIMAAFPAFFALYPNYERVNKVRELEYSNGVRPFALWLAYIVFDWLVVALATAVMVIILSQVVDSAFWKIGYFAVVLFLYGLTAILFGYCISMICKSQLSSFAFAAGGQAVLLLIYLVAYMEITTQEAPGQVDNSLLIMHFTFGIIAPIAQLLRALILGLNLFSAACTGKPPQKMSYGGDIVAYGGPILYLIIQALLLFGLLVWADSHFSFKTLLSVLPFFKSGSHPTTRSDTTESGTVTGAVAAEAVRAEQQRGGLRVLHLSKTFCPWYERWSRKKNKRVHAVRDVSFAIRPGEVFGLLGPNGAGKTTTISMMRGDISPDNRADTNILVCEQSILTNLVHARAHLGVCPQFDATDQLTVDDQLAFYARVRGVPDVQLAVDTIVRGVGLTRFRARLAHALSGGNKRKLSLGIALLGNPDVILLDEPSSGMDPLAKRVMWQIISRISQDKAILLTTHSMEEADVLAKRIGVTAGRMLDIGTAADLRQRYSHGFEVHIVTAAGPATTQAQMDDIASWFQSMFPNTAETAKGYLGQMRLKVPFESVALSSTDSIDRHSHGSGAGTPRSDPSTFSLGPILTDKEREMTSTDGMARLFRAIEDNKTRLGIEYYSVSPTSLDEVFVQVVKRNGALDEDMEEKAKKPTMLANLWRRMRMKQPSGAAGAAE